VRTRQNLWALGTFSLGSILLVGADHRAFADNPKPESATLARKNGLSDRQGMPRPAAFGVPIGKKSELAKNISADRPPTLAKAPQDRPARAAKLTEAKSSIVAIARSPRSGAFLASPSLYETGRVGTTIVSDAGFGIQPTQDRAMPVEHVVRPRAVDINRPLAGSRPGLVSGGELAQQLGRQVPTLDGCRLEVARQQRLPWNEVAAGRVTLQWNILSTGAVADPTVVAIDPIDLHVLDCVYSKMRQWTFARPSRGTIVHVSQPFAFR
jgi:hypothetical protein